MDNRQRERPTPPHGQVGQVIDGRYELVRELGKGKQGKVWLAIDPTRNSENVVLKLFSGDSPRSEREIQILRELQSPYVVRYLDHGTVDGTPDGPKYLALAYEPGFTLLERLTSPTGYHTALRIAVGMLKGLRDVHALGVIHRDIKPANLLVVLDTGAVHVKLLDFGIVKVKDASKLTKTGGAPGTPAYMAPELLRGKTPDERSDLWSVGAVMHEMLCGELPPDDETVELSRDGHRKDLPAEVHSILRCALRENRDERYATAGDMLQAIEQFLSQDAGSTQRVVADLALPTETDARSVSPSMQAQGTRRRRRKVALVAAAIVLGVPLAAFAIWRISMTTAASEPSTHDASTVSDTGLHMAANDDAHSRSSAEVIAEGIGELSGKQHFNYIVREERGSLSWAAARAKCSQTTFNLCDLDANKQSAQCKKNTARPADEAYDLCTAAQWNALTKDDEAPAVRQRQAWLLEPNDDGVVQTTSDYDPAADIAAHVETRGPPGVDSGTGDPKWKSSREVTAIACCTPRAELSLRPGSSMLHAKEYLYRMQATLTSEFDSSVVRNPVPLDVLVLDPRRDDHPATLLVFNNWVHRNVVRTALHAGIPSEYQGRFRFLRCEGRFTGGFGEYACITVVQSKLAIPVLRFSFAYDRYGYCNILGYGRQMGSKLVSCFSKEDAHKIIRQRYTKDDAAYCRWNAPLSRQDTSEGALYDPGNQGGSCVDFLQHLTFVERKPCISTASAQDDDCSKNQFRLAHPKVSADRSSLAFPCGTKALIGVVKVTADENEAQVMYSHAVKVNSTLPAKPPNCTITVPKDGVEEQDARFLREPNGTWVLAED